jgi:dienelactone hydrolase
MVSSDPLSLTVSLADGEVPVVVSGRDSTAATSLPGLLCVPSIFGANPDLVAQLASVSDVALTAVMDPFWRVEAGPIPYEDREAAFARVGKLDRSKVLADVEAVARWLGDRTNGSVAGLGICFGGPSVLIGASAGWLAGAVTWHGSRMEQVLDQIDTEAATAPLRLHFGDADPMSPPEVVEAISATFAGHPDCSIVVHPGADHGFSHEGPAWQASAAEAGLADLRALLERLRG